MESIKEQLQITNCTLQRRAVSKLMKRILKESETKKFESSFCKLPELMLLWDHCANGSSSSSGLCSAALMNLAVSGNVDAVTILDGYLNVLPSAKNIPVIIADVVNLWLHVHLRNRNLHRDYLIDLLKSRSDSAILLLEKLLHLLRQNTELPKSELIPVLKYIWLNPIGDISMSGLSNQVLEEFAKSDCLIDEYEFVLDVLQKLQLKTTSSFHNYGILLRKVSTLVFVSNDNVLNEAKIEQLDHIMMLCLAAYEMGLHIGNDSVLLLDVAMEIANVVSEHANTFHGNAAYLLISYLITQAAGNSICILLNIANVLLKREGLLLSVAFSALFPLLQLHAGVDIENKYLTSLQAKMIHKIESLRSNIELKQPHSSVSIHAFTVICYEAILTVETMQSLEKASQTDKVEFLKKVAEQECFLTKSRRFIFIFVTSMIRKDLGIKLVTEYLFRILIKLMECDPPQSIGIFPFLLYCLNKEQDPECQFEILHMLPCLGKHKHCVASVLSTLHLLAGKDSLKAQTLCSMTQLWKQNPRTFPFLHKMLASLSTYPNKNIARDLRLEILCSIASTARDVCEISPAKYGREVLAPLAMLLNECTNKYTSPASSMALQGIFFLCSAEVVNIRTVWKVLEPLLLMEKRPLIVKNIFEVISLVPSLHVPTAEYEQFTEKIVHILWNYVDESSCSITIGAAYNALSRFSSKHHTLKLIPQVAKEDLKVPSDLISTPLDLAKSPEEMLDYVPDECYIRLLKNINDPNILENFGHFLSSLVEDEVSNLPRRVYSTAVKVPEQRVEDHALGKIPGFLCSQYEANRFPVMKGSLAVGVLFSYEPPAPTGRDSVSMKRSLVDNVKFCERVLEALLQDVPHDAFDWNRSPLLPGAWIAFNGVIFKSCEEGHQAQMDLLPENTNGSEKIPAWIAARNGLVEVIKNGSKGKPSSHANAILALTGVVLAVADFNESLNNRNMCSLKDDWLSSAIETILGIAFPMRKPESSIFSWLMKNPYKSSQSGAALVQGTALLALSHLVSFLGSDISLIRSLLEVMINQTKLDTGISQFYGSLGLGMFVAALCKAGFVELKETSGENTVLHFSIALEECIFTEDNDVINGPLFGLTVVVVALTNYGSNNCHEYANEVCSRLKGKLYSHDPSSTSYDILAFSVSVMYSSAASRNLIPSSEVISLTEWMISRKNCQPNCAGTALCLGILLETMVHLNVNHEAISYDLFMKQWMTTVSSEEQNTLARLSSLRGLMALFSGGVGLCPFLSNNSENSKLNDVVREIIKFSRSSRDTGLLSCSSWFLGLVFHNWREQQTSTFMSGVSSYSYLGDKSVLKVVVECIVNQNSEEESHIAVCLNSLAERSSVLPPINWGNVLSALLFQQASPNLSFLALKIVLNQMPTSTTASALFTTCVSLPNAHSLPLECKELLIKSLPKISRALESSKLQLLLQNIFLKALGTVDKTCQVLDAFYKTVTTSELSESNKKTLYETISIATVMLVSNKELLKHEHAILLSITNCIRELPDECLEGILQNCEELDVVLRCYLVQIRRKPLTWILPCFENVPSHKEEEILSLLHQCCSAVDSTEERIAWLLELIGRSNHLLREKMINELTFVVKTFLVSVVSWTSYFWFESNIPLWKLSGALHILLERDDYKNLTPKVLEWLISLTESSELAEEALRCVWLLRHTKEFENPHVWTKVL